MAKETKPTIDLLLENSALKTYTVVDGDTWAGIADAHRPAGVTKHDYAVTLHDLNGGNLTAGRVINL